MDVDNGFKPLYVVVQGKKERVTKLKALLKDASKLYLATDEDQEGESDSVAPAGGAQPPACR